MTELKKIDLSVRAERAFLIGVVSSRSRGCNKESLEELARLAKTAGAFIVDGTVQKKSRKDPTYYIGKGKALELASLCRDRKIDVVICDDDLAPAQVKNLETTLNSKVVDRSELILDIFAHRARTRQAQMQVELAQLEYTQPRLKRMWTHLDRYEGGIGTRGPGEKQLETDRRIVSKKIHELKKKLKEIEGHRRQEVASRKECFKVSLVGYTNAGKSTLMNALTEAAVPVEDKLFSTLDTKTRLLRLGHGREALLSDTIGFIKKLPHHLVASFHATLEEVRQADLLLHVVDVSSPSVLEQVAAADEALRELESEKKPTILVLNKTDIISDDTITTLFRAKYPHAISVSALTGWGLDELRGKIVEFIDEKCVDLKLTCGTADGRLSAYLYEKGCVLSKRTVHNKLHFHVLIEEKYIPIIKKLSSGAEVSYPEREPLKL
ncbi:MAG: GTPase HflX [Candidatus Brocadiales bacterium]|nr:GTPase HflX [Candidatus Bathyanammoxibius sp.]